MEGIGVNQNTGDGDIDFSEDIYNLKDINYDKNDNEALNGSDIEPLSLYLSESGDDSNFIFSDDDSKCNDRDENYSEEPDKVVVQISIAPEPILDMNMNMDSDSESLSPAQPVAEVEESVCYICGVSVL